MDWTGATNTPDFKHNATLNVYGAYTGIAGMTNSGNNSYLIFRNNSQTVNITFGAAFAGTHINFGSDSGVNLGNWTLLDTLVISLNQIAFYAGTLNTNGQIINCRNFLISLAHTKVLTTGASIINCSGTAGTGFDYTGTNLTLTANTATINISGTGTFTGGGITTYHDVNLNGTAHTISGSNTFNSFNLASGVTQTIKFTDGTTQTATTYELSGSAGHVHTLQGTGAAGWYLTKV